MVSITVSIMLTKDLSALHGGVWGGDFRVPVDASSCACSHDV